MARCTVKALIAATGDIAMLSQEVTPVLKALRANGLNVVAIHHHMMGRNLPFTFCTIGGTGPAEKLGGFKAVLGELGKGKATGAKAGEHH
jgi:hypothetical protein